MQHISKNNLTNRDASGFTLIEMLIISPIVILAIGGFIALMVTMVGSVLATRDQTMMLYESQDTLTRVEDDIRLSAQFLTTTGALRSPQGSDSNFTGSAAFTNSASRLVLLTLATTKNPADSTRELVYYKNQPNACTTEKVFNQVYFSQVIYFINNGSLWRRTILPPYNTNATADYESVCNTPWQQNSCSPGYVSTLCQANDIELMENVASMDIDYYATPNSTTDLGPSGAPDASSVKVTVNGSKTVAGRTISVSQSTRATRLNVAVSPPTMPPLQFTSHPANATVIHSDTNVQFTAAPSLSRATLQWQRSTNGGSIWSNITGATSATYTLATVSTSLNGYQYRVIASTPEESVISNPAVLTVTLWGSMNYLNGYSRYASAYTDLGYTKTARGVVMLKGMVKKSSDVVSGEVIAILPPGKRPTGRLLFQSTSAGVAGRIDVYASGEIRAIYGDKDWMSLDGITFIPAGGYGQTLLTLMNGWTQYDTVNYAPGAFATDSLGRVHVQGLVRPGTNTDNTQIASNMTARPSKYMHIPGRANPRGAVGIDPVKGVVSKGSASDHLALQTMYYPSSFVGWSSFTLLNGWVSLDGGTSFTTPGYAKGDDNIVRMKGLIRDGNTAAGTVVGTLPAGYRPATRTLLPAICNPNVECRIDILPTGSIELYSSNAGWTSLDHVTFLAEQ